MNEKKLGNKLSELNSALTQHDFSDGTHVITIPIHALAGLGMRVVIPTFKTVSNVSGKAFNGSWVDLTLESVNYNGGIFPTAQFTLQTGFVNGSSYGVTLRFTVS